MYVFEQLEEGKLWFQLACGLGGGGSSGSDSSDMLGISSRRINDGSWHTVVLELNRNFSSLAVDDSYVERRRGPPFIQPLTPDRSVYFGALVSPRTAVAVSAPQFHVINQEIRSTMCCLCSVSTLTIEQML